MRNGCNIYDRRRERDERRRQVIDVWKQIVEVQQHFNDISMRIRSMFVTILLALFASVGFLLDKKLELKVLSVEIQFAVLMPLFGIVGTLLFYFIDRYWYHRILMGAVKQGSMIEEKYKAEMPELGLGAAISAESPFTPNRFVRCLAKVLVRHRKSREEGRLHSDAKIELFYKSVVLILLLLSIALACFGNVSVRGKTLSDFLTPTVERTQALSSVSNTHPVSALPRSSPAIAAPGAPPQPPSGRTTGAAAAASKEN